jgi:hypothetical protein
MLEAAAKDVSVAAKNVDATATTCEIAGTRRETAASDGPVTFTKTAMKRSATKSPGFDTELLGRMTKTPPPE